MTLSTESAAGSTAAGTRQPAFTVSSVDLAPIPGIHDGTGHHVDSRWCVVPSTVPGTGQLAFEAKQCGVTCLLFALADTTPNSPPLVPNWFGVAIPDGLTDFSNVTVYFHPSPGQAGYLDSDYPTKTGLWPNLFYYMQLLGYQLAASGRAQVLVMPFLTSAASNAGILPASWQDILPEVLRQARVKVGADDGTTVTIANVAIASFSVGIVYMMAFRDHGVGLSGVLREVWDFDGVVSSAGSLSTGLVSTTAVTAIKYDEINSTSAGVYHVPTTRWTARPTGGPTSVHQWIVDYMYLHAASVSGVGGALSATAGGGGPVGPGVAPPPGVPVGTGAPVGTVVPVGTGVPAPPGVPVATGVPVPPGVPVATGVPGATTVPSGSGVLGPPLDIDMPLPLVPPGVGPVPPPPTVPPALVPAEPGVPGVTAPPPAVTGTPGGDGYTAAAATVASVSAVAVSAITAITALGARPGRAPRPAPPEPPRLPRPD